MKTLAKFVEPKQQIPMLEELQEVCPTKYSLKEIKSCELLMLSKVKFALKSVTVYDFANAVGFICGGIEKPKELFEIIDTSYTGRLFFRVFGPKNTDADYSLYKYKTSFVAAGCLLCYRKQLDLQPLWPESWSLASGYSIESIEAVALHIMK